MPYHSMVKLKIYGLNITIVQKMHKLRKKTKLLTFRQSFGLTILDMIYTLLKKSNDVFVFNPIIYFFAITS
jgi:hypothetical protein